jgi:Helix-turn-helix domain
VQAQTERDVSGSSHHEFLTVEETSKYLRISLLVLTKMRYERRGPRFFKPSRKMTLYKKSDLDAWLEACAKNCEVMA